jgi:hypothetical protein
LPTLHGGCILAHMDHQEFLAGIDPATRARLTERSDATGLLRLALHAGAIVLAGWLIAVGTPGWWAILPVQGVLIVALFMLEHEASHRTPFRSVRERPLPTGWCTFWHGTCPIMSSTTSGPPCRSIACPRCRG